MITKSVDILGICSALDNKSVVKTARSSNDARKEEMLHSWRLRMSTYSGNPSSLGGKINMEA